MSALETAFFFVHWLNVVAGISLALTNLIKFKQTKIYSLILMVGALLNYAFINLILIFVNMNTFLKYDHFIFYYITHPISLQQLLGNITVILMAIVVANLIVFFNQFNSKNFAVNNLLGLVTIIGILSIFFVSISEDNYLILSIPELKSDILIYLWTPLSYLFLVPPIAWLAIVVTKNLKASLTENTPKKQRTQINLMRYGLWASFIIGPSLSFLGDLLVYFNLNSLGFWVSEILGFLVITLGISTITISYVIDDSLLFLQGSRVERIMVIQDSGLTLFNYEFQPHLGNSQSQSLIGGLLLTIQNVSKDVIGEEDLLETIKFGKSEIIFRNLNNLLFVLQTKRTSNFLYSALKQFSEEFCTYFEDATYQKVVSDRFYNQILPQFERIFGIKSSVKNIREINV